MRNDIARWSALAVIFLGAWVGASPVLSPGNFKRISNDTTTTPTITAAASQTEPTATSTCTVVFNPYLDNIDVDDYAKCNGTPATLVPARNVWEYVTWNTGMASRCSASYASAISEYSATAPALVFTVTQSSDNVAVKTSTYSIHTGDPFNFVPPSGSECCLNCTLYGESVNVYHWATSMPTGVSAPNATITSAPASPSLISMLVNDANFTFTSPSIYVAFHSLSAGDYCGQVGPVVENATIAFRPGELMTARGWSYNGSIEEPPTLPDDFQVGDWNTQPTCGDITSAFFQNRLNREIWTDPAASPTSCKTELCWIETYTITWDPCKPRISVPSQVFGINTAWHSCQKGVAAILDPPYHLTPGNGLTPLTITAPGNPSTQLSTPTSTPAISVAQPGSTVVPATPPKTSPPSTPPIASPNPSNNDPSPNNLSPADPTPSDSPTKDPPSNASPSKDSSNNNSPESVPAGNTPENTPSKSSGTANKNPSQNPATTTAAEYIIGGQTIIPNGPAVTVSGTTYSLLPSGTIVINGETRSFVHGGSSTYIIGSQWLIAGSSAITVDGTKVSLMSGGSSVVVGGTTEAVNGFIAGTGTQTRVASISLNGYVTPTKPASRTGGSSTKGQSTKSGAGRVICNTKTGVVLVPLVWSLGMILGIMRL